MPPVVVLFVCRVALAGLPDQNAAATGAENLQWDTKDSMMHCRRIEVQMTDPAADQGAIPQPFTQQRCQQSGAMLVTSWDEGHKNTNYRVWRYACPVPIINNETGQVIDYKLPECPANNGIVVCDVDSAI